MPARAQHPTLAWKAAVPEASGLNDGVRGAVLGAPGRLLPASPSFWGLPAVLVSLARGCVTGLCPCVPLALPPCVSSVWVFLLRGHQAYWIRTRSVTSP